MISDLYDLYDLAHVAAWEWYKVCMTHCRTCFLGWICTTQSSTASRNGGLESTVDDISVDDLSIVVGP